MPLFSARIPFQKASLSRPMQVIGPSPVITARRFMFCPRNTRKARNKAKNMVTASSLFGSFRLVHGGLQILFHTAQSLAGDWINEEIADDNFRERCKQGNTKPEVMNNFDPHTIGHVVKSPNNVHSFRERFQMVKSYLNIVAIDHLL